MIAAKKHEEAMREMARRKAAQQASVRRGAGRGVSSSVAASKGISAGVRTKNKHLQDFENIKSSHKRRKGVDASIVLLGFDNLKFPYSF